jgi:D-glycero-D-manno-heptose 1,7-bisphosphate phosphatase
MSVNTNYSTLFLDRDGVINRKIENGYVLKSEDIELMPGIKEFLIWANQNFSQILVVTNQRCIGRKLLREEELLSIHKDLNDRTGNFIDDFLFCPHLHEENCGCRKPKDGLFLKAAENYVVDFNCSWMIGDSVSDLIPAKNLGIKTIYIGTEATAYADFTLTSTSELFDVFRSG